MITNKQDDGHSSIHDIIHDDIYRVKDYKDRDIKTIIDIGANIGVFSIMMRMLHPNARIIAIEPHYESFKYLKYNTHLLKIETCQYALGNGETFFLQDGNTDLTKHVFMPNKTDSSPVISKRLSDLFNLLKINNKKYLIKISCEGAEQFLLDDPESIKIINNSLQTVFKISFQLHDNNSLLKNYFAYEKWVNDNFKHLNNVTYYKSNKKQGFGHYCIKPKGTVTNIDKQSSRAYSTKYYKSHNDKTRNYSETVAKDLIKRYKVKSLVDFGCGCGFYVETALNAGIKAIGYEKYLSRSSEFMNESILPWVIEGDVTQPIPCGKFDCAISIEVGEHIPEANSDQLVDNICDASDRLIIFTAAHPGQSGKGHINCQNREFWIEKFEKRGWKYLPKEVKKTRKIWSNLKCANQMPYLIENIMFFTKRKNVRSFVERILDIY